MSLRVVLADDHTVVLQGLRALLGTEPDIEVVEICTDGVEAVEAAERLRPDVMIIDQSMPNCSGTLALARIREFDPDAAVILLTASLDDETLLKAVRLGVSGVVLKESAASQLIECVRVVSKGERCIPALIMNRALELATAPAATASNELSLTPREMDVARGVTQGYSNKRIAKDCGISDGTVKAHLHNIFKKFDVDNRVQLMLRLRDSNLVQ